MATPSRIKTTSWWSIGGIIATLIMFFGYSISITAIGWLYFLDCPFEPKMPIYLVVNGAVLTVTGIGLVVEMFVPNRAIETFIYVCGGFLVVWFLFGCYWIYGHFPSTFASKFCSAVVYYAALASVTVPLIILTLELIVAVITFSIF